MPASSSSSAAFSLKLRNRVTFVNVSETAVCSWLLSIRFVRVVDLVRDSRAQQQSSVARLGAGPDNGSFAQVTIPACVDDDDDDDGRRMVVVVVMMVVVVVIGVEGAEEADDDDDDGRRRMVVVVMMVMVNW